MELERAVMVEDTNQTQIPIQDQHIQQDLMLMVMEMDLIQGILVQTVEQAE
jgi:hypothetical protein